VIATLALASTGLAQYREYYAYGRVLDAQKKPLPNVEISLLDASTSRRFHMKTDQKGEFKFAGLPHADYEVTFAREGYGRFQLRPGDLLETLRAPGFRRLVRRHWRMGLEETVRDYSRRLFVASARKLLPELEPGDVVPGPSGIRAQALAADGSLVDDFVLERRPGVVHVRNAPSPGATSSLTIADTIAALAEEAFGLVP